MPQQRVPMDLLTGLRNERRSMGDGTMGGRSRLATPYSRVLRDRVEVGVGPIGRVPKHTHPGTPDEIPLPPLDHEFTHIATIALANVGRLRATTGERVWVTSSAGNTIRAVSIDPDSGDYFAVRSDGSAGGWATWLLRYDKNSGANSVVGQLPQSALTGGTLRVVPGGRAYYMPGASSNVSVWAINLSDASVIWESPIPSGAASGLVVSRDGLYLYAGETSSTTTERHVSRITAANGDTERVVDLLGAQPAGLALSPGGTRLYVGVSSPSELRQYGVDGGVGWVLNGPVSGLDTHPGTGDVFSIRVDPKDGSSRNLYINDANTGDEIEARIMPPGASGASGFYVSPDGERAYYTSVISASYITYAVDAETLGTIWTSPTAHGVRDVAYSEG